MAKQGMKKTSYLVSAASERICEIVQSSGSIVLGKDGKKYIDFTMGWCVGNIGWGNLEIRKQIRSYKGPDYVSPNFYFQPWEELAKLIVSMMPKKLTKCFRTTGGSESVEIALELANAYTRRHKFIAIEGAYHGDTIGALSMGDSAYRKYHPNLLLRTQKIKPPLNEKLLENIEKLLQKKEVAAVIMEPIICNLGVEIPTAGFMKGLQSLCKKYGTLLIIDEVATGFGRTGKMFGYQHYAIQPDIICLGKGISGGYGGLGATVTTSAIADSLSHGGYWSTYGWHPLGTIAAIANIKFLKKHEKKLLQHTAVMSDYFKTQLSKINFKYKPMIRIKGLAIAVEFKQNHYAAQIVERARQSGLIISLSNERRFSLFPALTIDLSTAKKGLAILESCLW